MLIFLKNLDYIDYNDNQTINCFLKLKGWSYLARLHSKSDSNQVFVAMKMGDDEALNNLYIMLLTLLLLQQVFSHSE